MMQSKGNLLMRDDTFFGVCEGLGEDLRVPSNLFRAGFAISLFFSPAGAVIAYFGLGVLVLVSRLAFPESRARKPALTVAETQTEAFCGRAQVDAQDVEEEPQLAAAA